MCSLTLSILILPFIGFYITFISTYFFGSKKVIALFPTFLMGINAIIAIYLCYVGQNLHIKNRHELLYVDLGTWIESGLFEVRWEFYFDNLTVIMLIVVNVISFLVHLYSLDYMLHDPNQGRFMSYLSLFTFFMILLITGDNFIILFLGWEGVGLCSYLLISFWYTRIQANKSAIKALIVNRISDFGLTIGIICIYFIFKSLNFAVVFATAPLFQGKTFLFFGMEFDILSTIAALLFFGACGKSAQIGLHTWLPDAMEGPTPVSALIHAATMVTAGVFLIIKCSPIFEYAPLILTIITFVGALTAFFAATAGLVQNDIKKVIAYSTCSQLGYMIFACGLSSYHVSFFHLINHAFFKALLFLSAGAIIHSLSNEQDMRRYGALFTLLPFTSVMLLIGSLSLMGFPFLTGFYSKDLILEIAYSKYTVSSTFAYWLGLITAFLTSFYSYRVFYLTCVCKNNSYKQVVKNVHELPIKMAVALMILALGSIFLGYITKDLFVGLGTNFWDKTNSIFISDKHNTQLEAEFIPHIFKLLPFFSSMLSIVFANFLFEFNIPLKINRFYNFIKVYNFISYKWYFDAIYNRMINIPILQASYNRIFIVLDKGLLELVGPYGLSELFLKLGINLKMDQDGEAYRYGGFIFFFTILLIFIYHFYL